MSLRNLCFFAVLAAMFAFPAVRKVEVEVEAWPDTRTPNSPNIQRPSAVFRPVQSRNPKDLGPGKLLVASRELGDPNFAETVILLVHYDTDSVVGLMLNRLAPPPGPKPWATKNKRE